MVIKQLSYFGRALLFIIILCLIVKSRNENEDECFCQLQGQVDDCSCTIDTLDYFNNYNIYPIISAILVKDYFRFVKVNMERKCPFWPDDSSCVLKDCSVQMCTEDEIPPGLKGSGIPLHNKYLEAAQSDVSCDENNKGLGAVNHTISDETFEDFKRWSFHDDQQDNFCEMDDEQSSESHYVDLLLNPERFTGYSGTSAHRIWKSLYQENCFRPDKSYGPFSTSQNLNSLCLEKRVFYRAISGLHTSINIHLCATYFFPGKNAFEKPKWGPNLTEFKKRFQPDLTDGEGPQRLRNLYFLYLLELRALAKVSNFLQKEVFFTGSPKDDEDVRKGIENLLEMAKSFPDHFNESIMFSGKSQEALTLKEEFKNHFRNVSRIMDCVGCSKCKLWGKLQVQGLGTAFKILFSGESKSGDRHKKTRRNRFHLTRAEIVTFLNAFGKLSSSIHNLEVFRKMLTSS